MAGIARSSQLATSATNQVGWLKTFRFVAADASLEPDELEEQSRRKSSSDKKHRCSLPNS